MLNLAAQCTARKKVSPLWLLVFSRKVEPSVFPCLVSELHNTYNTTHLIPSYCQNPLFEAGVERTDVRELIFARPNVVDSNIVDTKIIYKPF